MLARQLTVRPLPLLWAPQSDRVGGWTLPRSVVAEEIFLVVEVARDLPRRVPQLLSNRLAEKPSPVERLEGIFHCIESD